MKTECEMDLVELVTQELEGNPELAQPSAWESEVNELIQQQREVREAEAMARGPRLVPHGLTSPRRVAEEMHSRSFFLRTKPGARYTKKRELEILAELDAIEAQARDLDLQHQLCALSDAKLAAEMADLSLAVFAVRGRYADLLDAQDLPFPARATPPDPEARRRELAEIEAFLARKKAREPNPDSSPKAG